MSDYILRRRLAPFKFNQLCLLWEQMASRLTNTERIFVTQEVTDSIKCQFRLLASKQFNALLWGEQLLDESFIRVSIALDSLGVKQLIEEIKSSHQGFEETLNKVKIYSRSNSAKVMSILTLELLDILAPEAHDVSYPRFLNNNIPADEILRHQIEQERILNQVTLQINQNKDWLSIIKMTLAQVQILLKVDRLAIYQLDVEVISEQSSEKQLVDMVTYEARAYEEIPSIMNFKDESCFSSLGVVKDKYRQGFSLGVEDVDSSLELSPCLKILMKKLKIKAKLVSPILVQGKLWGFLIAHQCFTPRRWKPSTIQFLEQVAEYLAIAIYQNQSYQQLQQQKKLLESQVSQRAKELKEALLAAQVAHQSKSEFLDNMTHELRTPLTCIIGLSRTLVYWSEQKVSLPSEQMEKYLKTIEDSGKQLLGLINEILDFARIEAGKTVLNLKKIRASQLARNALENIKAKALEREITIKLENKLNSKNDYFSADGERVEQILLHLLDNAIKFSQPQKEVILRVWGEDKKIIFQVEDSGIGISQNQLPLLFEKFQQLEHSRVRSYGGAGLGLALTKQLVELHGGTIEVESTPDQGSLFTVKLPAQNLLKSKPKPAAITQDSVKKNLIILLTKQEGLATFIYELLTVANYQLIWLMDSNAALFQIEMLEPQIVMIDQELLETEELANTLRAREKTANLKIIILCKKINLKSKKIIDEYLVLPIEPTSLLEKIENLSKC